MDGDFETTQGRRMPTTKSALEEEQVLKKKNYRQQEALLHHHQDDDHCVVHSQVTRQRKHDGDLQSAAVKIIPYTGLPTFPFLLHKMLNDAELYGFEEVVSWLNDGRSFKIHDKQKFVCKIIFRYFRNQHQYKSFQRQLNIYGFVRIVKGNCHEKGGYTHKYLFRREPQMCRYMVRTVKSKFPPCTTAQSWTNTNNSATDVASGSNNDGSTSSPQVVNNNTPLPTEQSPNMPSLGQSLSLTRNILLTPSLSMMQMNNAGLFQSLAHAKYHIDVSLQQSYHHHLLASHLNYHDAGGLAGKLVMSCNARHQIKGRKDVHTMPILYDNSWAGCNSTADYCEILALDPSVEYPNHDDVTKREQVPCKAMLPMEVVTQICGTKEATSDCLVRTIANQTPAAIPLLISSSKLGAAEGQDEAPHLWNHTGMPYSSCNMRGFFIDSTTYNTRLPSTNSKPQHENHDGADIFLIMDDCAEERCTASLTLNQHAGLQTDVAAELVKVFDC